MRVLYYDLTGDAAITNDTISKELEERLKMMLLLEDPSIIVDMRINNGFKGTKFDHFWNELDAYFNEVISSSFTISTIILTSKCYLF